MGPVTPTLGSGIFALLPGLGSGDPAVMGSTSMPGTSGADQSPINVEPGRAEPVVDPQKLAAILDPLIFGNSLSDTGDSSAASDDTDPTLIGYDQFGAAEAFDLASLGQEIDVMNGNPESASSQTQSMVGANAASQTAMGMPSEVQAPGSTASRFSPFGIGLPPTAFEQLYG